MGSLVDSGGEAAVSMPSVASRPSVASSSTVGLTYEDVESFEWMDAVSDVSALAGVVAASWTSSVACDAIPSVRSLSVRPRITRVFSSLNSTSRSLLSTPGSSPRSSYAPSIPRTSKRGW